MNPVSIIIITLVFSLLIKLIIKGIFKEQVSASLIFAGCLGFLFVISILKAIISPQDDSEYIGYIVGSYLLPIIIAVFIDAYANKPSKDSTKEQ